MERVILDTNDNYILYHYSEYDEFWFVVEHIESKEMLNIDYDVISLLKMFNFDPSDYQREDALWKLH